MLRVVSRVLLVLALCGVLGLQWVTLQSVAWTVMLVNHAKHSSLSEALADTFNGAHPCSLCHAVRKGQETQEKTSLQWNGPTVDLICTTHLISLVPPFELIRYLSPPGDVSSLEETPPSPPPRVRLG